MKRLNKKEKTLLDLLAAGQSVAMACDASGIPESTYYYKRKNDKEFEVLTDNAKRHGDEFKEARASGGTPLGLVEDQAQKDFLIAYSKTGNKEEAAKAAGVEYKSIVLAMDPDEPEYDVQFAGEMTRMEKVIASKLEDKMLARTIKGDARDAANNVRWYLEKRFPQKYGQKQKVEVEGKVTYGLDADAAMNIIEKIFSLPEGSDIKDVTGLVAQEPRRVLPAAQT